MSNHSSPFNVQVDVTILCSGHCKQLEKFITKTGKWRSISIPALFAYIKHPVYGSILFDTGYSNHFFSATRKMPYLFYRYVTPVSISNEKSGAAQLKKQGIDPEDIDIIILSHFHADHVGALKEYPNAQFIYLQKAIDQVKSLHSVFQTKAGYLPDLLPKDFYKRSSPIDEQRTINLPKTFPFERGLDLFGDGSIIAVDLPGHAAGQIGVLLETKERPYFLCADGVWESNAFRKRTQPHWLTNFITHNRQEAKQTFNRICEFHERHPEYLIVPSHCREIWQSVKSKMKGSMCIE